MPDRDGYAAYYSEKLWNLLPGIYRSLDAPIGDDPGLEAPGPLRELVDRIGVQAAILRRSIDRLWEDQSIESCDDWVIPYVADLLATNLVPVMDARGQRLDVAKTIHYRRRKGTVPLLEELAADVTGWEARVVEFFRRLGRSRHSFDPPLLEPGSEADPGGARALELAEGLSGPRTNTAIGGTADLRSAYGATRAHSAFDEYFHTADVRLGRGMVGWYDIPHLGVFTWRLQSFGVHETTPVALQGCPGQYTFDPTGREIPLFAKDSRLGAGFGAGWVSPEEWQLPTPIRRLLLANELARVSHPLAPGDMERLYPASLAVFHLQGSFSDLVDEVSHLRFFPERGRFAVDDTLVDDTLHVTYHHGFSSTIGAGPYDRRVLRQPPPPRPAPEGPPVAGGGSVLAAPLGGLAPSGTLTIRDSLTCTAVAAVNGIQHVTVRAANGERPVVRLPAPAPDPAQWAFTGAEGSELVLEGLLVSGGDVVLRGTFDRVRLVCCTFDPGSAGAAPNSFAKAADGRDLVPCHLRVEGEVRELVVERCIVGPIGERPGGSIEVLEASDSIVQGLWAEQAIALRDGAARVSRCTVLGGMQVHRLEASECIVDGVVLVDDTQHGCMRFSARTTGSAVPRPYESVEIAPAAPAFTSRVFGQPGYCQLLASADLAIVSGRPGASILEGAEDGSEMGAFAREKNPLKQRGLEIKYREFMPLGLAPVYVAVT